MTRVDSAVSRNELLELGCAELAQAFQQGRHTPVEVLEALRQAIENDDQGINAFCHFDWPGAFEAARASGQRYRTGSPLGPLDGVPMSIKDLMDVEGWPTRRGSRVLANAGGAVGDAPVVSLLRAAGAVLFGKTTTTEFGWTIRSDNPLTGLTRNPLDPAHSAGGSSSGSAAQVAAGWGAVALGSDAGGSVRVPASYCGLVGFKPSFGAIPMIPSSAFTDFAHMGVLARSVADARIATAVMAHPDGRDLASSFPRVDIIEERPVRLGWALVLGADQQPAAHVASAFHAGLEQLRSAGYQLEEVDPQIQDCADAMWDIWRSRIYESFYTWPASQREQLGAGLQQLYQEGATMSLLDVAAARTRLRQMQARLGEVFGNIDILLTPMMPDSAPVAAEADVAEQAAVQNWFRQSGYSYPFNVTGQPALSLPMGLCPKGLPLGMQVVGRKYHDSRVLKLAAELEALLGHEQA